MKWAIQIHTERGSFKSKQIEVPEKEAEDLKDMILHTVSNSNYFKFETDDGYVVLSKALLQSAAFVVTEEDNEGEF